MKLIKMTCPNCNANLEIDGEQKQAFCVYCGTRLAIDDESRNVNFHYYDEAKLKEAEIRKSEVDTRLERYAREDAEFEEKYEKWKNKFELFKKTQYLWICFVIAVFLQPMTGDGVNTIVSTIVAIIAVPMAIGGMIAYFSLIFYGPYLYFTNPKRKHRNVIALREAEEARIKESERRYEIEKLRAQNQKSVHYSIFSRNKE